MIIGHHLKPGMEYEIIRHKCYKNAWPQQSVSAVFADGFSYIESNGAHFVDWESVQKLGMNHLDNLIHDAPKKVQEQSTKNSMQRETVQNDVERE